MAKDRVLTGVTLTYPATTAYKQWVWKKIRERGWTLQILADEIKRADRSLPTTISTATLSDLLGPEDAAAAPSNTRLLPAINKVFGIAPPPVCDPTDEMQQLVEKFRRAWQQATPNERALVTAFLGGTDDARPVDRDRPGTGEVANGNRPPRRR